MHAVSTVKEKVVNGLSLLFHTRGLLTAVQLRVDGIWCLLNLLPEVLLSSYRNSPCSEQMTRCLHSTTEAIECSMFVYNCFRVHENGCNSYLSV
jgi:hypothetical protein